MEGGEKTEMDLRWWRDRREGGKERKTADRRQRSYRQTAGRGRKPRGGCKREKAHRREVNVRDSGWKNWRGRWEVRESREIARRGDDFLGSSAQTDKSGTQKTPEENSTVRTPKSVPSAGLLNYFRPFNNYTFFFYIHHFPRKSENIKC